MAAYDYVKLAAYLGVPHCDAYGHCQNYQLVQSGNQLTFIMQNVSTPSSYNTLPNITVGEQKPQVQINQFNKTYAIPN